MISTYNLNNYAPFPMDEILNGFARITLDEMSDIRLMNRTDTKFVTTIERLKELLVMAQPEYRIQEVDALRNIPYYTMYFDTESFDMYCEHSHGHTNRQKVRIRSYVNSNLNFLEVKTKDNHGRTKKKRISMHNFTPSEPNCNGFDCEDDEKALYFHFLQQHLKYAPERLSPAVENKFNRITLVNNRKTERLTIDTDLQFCNKTTGKAFAFDGIAIIELKRDGLEFSPVTAMLNALRIKPHGFSKYCLGSAMTNADLPLNKFKARLRAIEKLKEL